MRKGGLEEDPGSSADPRQGAVLPRIAVPALEVRVPVSPGKGRVVPAGVAGERHEGGT